MRPLLAGLLALSLGACQAPPPAAQPEDPTAHAGAHDVAGAMPVSAGAYNSAMVQMHRDMAAVTATADADESFVRMMIPHHQGAIEMARIVIEHGKDPATRALAKAVIAAQTREIREMEAWLAARGGRE